MSTPGLVIDDKVVASGRVLSEREIGRFLQDARTAREPSSARAHRIPLGALRASLATAPADHRPAQQIRGN